MPLFPLDSSASVAREESTNLTPLFPSIPPVVTSMVDLYLARERLRASVPMQGFSRVSDVFNSMPGEFLGATLHRVANLHDSTGQEIGSRDLVIRFRDLFMVEPVEERRAAVPISSERRQRTAQRVVLALGDWRLCGDLHLVDRVRWVDYLSTLQFRFVALTDVELSTPDAPEPRLCNFVLVNTARISALYESPD